MSSPTETEGFHPLVVADVERLCEDAVAVTFGVPEHLREAFRFRAGQYLTVRRHVDTDQGTREERRSYSICSPEGTPPRIGVRRVETGLFSSWLVDRLRPGEQIEVAPPDGRFSPPESTTEGEHHALIAAGSGITPVLSVAATVLAADRRHQVTLFYGNRRSDTVMFTEELADLKDRYGPRLQLDHVLSREPMDAEIFGGRLDRNKLRVLLGSLVPVPEVAHWWLCGPYGMVTDAQDVLGELGVARTRVHKELFYVDAPPPEPVRADETATDLEEGAEATVTLNGRSTSMTLPRSESVLDAAQRFRSDLPFACKGGVCGTCRAQVTDGEVRMRRNFALEPDEIEAGYVLTCQSLPVSETLAINYDV